MRVLVLARLGGRGKSSAVEIGEMTTKSAGLFQVDGDKVTQRVLLGCCARSRRAWPHSGGPLPAPPPRARRRYWRQVSRENIEILRRAIDAYNARDVEAFIAYCDPGIELAERPGRAVPR
jgi:hypothetical protein